MARPSRKNHLLRIIRESKGISPETMSRESGISTHNLWRAEVGRVISDKMVDKISAFLNISPDLIYYNMGRIPPDKLEFVKKDPIYFKEVIEDVCSEPWRLTKTEEFMDSLIEKKSTISPDIKKLLSRIKPSE
jgi:hypothetical protein